MVIKSKMDEFLNIKANKQRFIHYLSDNLDTVEIERERERGGGREVGREGGREGEREKGREREGGGREERERESWKHCRSCKR